MSEFKSWQCQTCGDDLGWIGRVSQFLFGCDCYIETPEHAAADWARAKRQAKMMLESIELRRHLDNEPKPRIAKNGDDGWVCASRSGLGFGSTPDMAFQSYLRDMKRWS